MKTEKIKETKYASIMLAIQFKNLIQSKSARSKSIKSHMKVSAECEHSTAANSRLAFFISLLFHLARRTNPNPLCKQRQRDKKIDKKGGKQLNIRKI